MRTFEYCSKNAETYPSLCLTLVAQIKEDQEKLERMQNDLPGVLFSLRDQAFYDTVDASARIEGIYLSPERVKELSSIDGGHPTNDQEEQITGFARVLRAMEKNPEFFTLSTSTLLAMHTVLFTGRNFDTRSRYRRKDYLDMVGPDGTVRRAKVSPINAFETPLCLGAMCDELSESFPAASSDAQLLAIPRFTIDFLCVRPFMEGCGRLVRLFSQLLLLSAGFNIGQYMSIDRLFEQDGIEYYHVLNDCTEGWDSMSNTYVPFTLYWLGRVHDAYQTLFACYGISADVPQKMKKTERIAHYFDRHSGLCTKQDIAAANPDISISTIENALRELVKSGRIRMIGSGRGAAYENANL